MRRLGSVGWLLPWVAWTLAGCGLVLDATAPPDATVPEAGAEGGGGDGGRPDARVDAAVGDAAADAETDAGPRVDAAPPCRTNGDCSDGVGCTRDRCREGVCLHEPWDGDCGEGEVCDPEADCVTPPECDTAADCALDPDSALGPCVRIDCDAGRCVLVHAPAGYAPVVREDRGAAACGCRLGETLPGGGSCATSAACPVPSDPTCRAHYVDWSTADCFVGFEPAGTPCDTGNLCVLGKTCDGEGNCGGGTEVACSDSGSCDPATGCSCSGGCGDPVVEEGPCVVAPGTCSGTRTTRTVTLTCVGGGCVPSAPVEDTMGCTLDEGDPCSPLPADPECVWGDDPCAPGKLVQRVCEGRCDGGGGCVEAGCDDMEIGTCGRPALGEGRQCGRERLETRGECRPVDPADVCSTEGVRTNVLRVPVCDAAGACNGVAYRDETVTCVLDTDGNRCDDGDPCTRNDRCGGGRCVGEPVACPTGQVCCPDTGRCAPACGVPEPPACRRNGDCDAYCASADCAGGCGCLGSAGPGGGVCGCL